MSAWRARFVDLGRYLRSRGWRFAFTLNGNRLTPIGMAARCPVGLNDNWLSRRKRDAQVIPPNDQRVHPVA